ncbi:MAG: HEAT repeat domain-containing protein [Anaerolineae bacterium]|jgi:HEAT repeat protein|nr:HEAT repeat domain-containing protein [Anaerolineae bacterium]MBT7075217.1 HEAT repeat domain-containing protein [Anaerolineae bacterium]MBT7782787.1 HEAT repeat domain-containing protein [Anaerolineae bacterium]
MDNLLRDLISGDETLAEAAMHKLIALGDEVFPTIRSLLDSPNADHRWWALSVLAQIEGADINWMLTALDDEVVEVRQSAALGLSIYPNSKTVSALIRSLYDEDSMVSTLASNALGKIGEDAVLPLLVVLDKKKSKIKKTQEQAARLGAMRALAKIADPRAIPAMMTALEEEDSLFLKHWAEVGLKELGQEMVYFNMD